MPDDGLKQLASAFGVKVDSTPVTSVHGDPTVARVVDDELSKLGYPSTARVSVLGDVGRENSWNRDTIFKGHQDPKNGAYNRGPISWQGKRQENLTQFLKQQGVYGQGNDDELRGMVRFMDQELRTSYPNEYAALRSARSTAEASKALYHYINYSRGINPKTGRPWHTDDPDYEVTANRPWAEQAKALGLAADQAQPAPLDDLANAFGAPTGADLSDLSASFAPTDQQQPAQPGTDPLPPGMSDQPDEAYMRESGIVSDTPDDRKAALLAQRQRTSDELKRAKTPARRNILLQRIKQIDDSLLKTDQEIRADAAAPKAADGQGRSKLTPVAAGKSGAYNDTSDDTQGQQQTQAPDKPAQYFKRHVEPTDEAYEFERSGKLKNGDEYLGTVDGKYRFRDTNGDEYEVADLQSGQIKYLKEPKSVHDSDNNEYTLAPDQKGVKDGVRRVRDGVNYIFSPDGKIREENPKLVLGEGDDQLSEAADQKNVPAGGKRVQHKDGRTFIAKAGDDGKYALDEETRNDAATDADYQEYLDYAKSKGSTPMPREQFNKLAARPGKTSVKAAFTETDEQKAHRLEVEKYQMEMGDYRAKNAKRPQARQAGKQQPARDDTRSSKYEINLGEKRADQSYSDFHNEYVANQLANELGVDYGTARAVVDRYPLQFKDDGTPVGETDLKAQADARHANTVIIGSDVKQQIKELAAKQKAKNTIYDKERSALADTPDKSPAELDLMAELRSSTMSGLPDEDKIRAAVKAGRMTKADADKAISEGKAAYNEQIGKIQTRLDAESVAYKEWLNKSGFGDEQYRSDHSLSFQRERDQVIDAYGSFANLKKRVDQSQGKYDYRPFAEPLSYLGLGSDDYEADEAAKGAFSAKHRLTDADIKSSTSLGEGIKRNPFFSPTSEFMKSAGSSFLSTGADFAAGLVRMNPLANVYKAVTGENAVDPQKLNDFAEKTRIFNEASTKDGLIFEAPHVLGDAFGAAPKIVGLTYLTGGSAIVAFALDAVVSNSHKPLKEQFQEGAKAAILGSVFEGISPFAKFVGSRAAARYLSPEVLEALNNPNTEKSFVDSIKEKALKIQALAESGAPGEKENAQRALDALLKKYNLKESDLTAEPGKYSPEVQAAIKRALTAKFIAERGTAIGLVSGAGYATAKLEGRSDREAAKSALLFAIQDAVFGILGKKGDEELTPEDIAHASEHVVSVPDEAGKPRDVLLLADEEGLHAVDVTGNVPPDAIDAAVVPPPPKPKPVSPSETVAPGEEVDIAEKGPGVVVEDKGKNVVVDHNPKVDKNGETKYQSRGTVRKDDLSRVPETPAETTAETPTVPSRPLKPIKAQGIQLAPRDGGTPAPASNEVDKSATPNNKRPIEDIKAELVAALVKERSWSKEKAESYITAPALGESGIRAMHADIGSLATDVTDKTPSQPVDVPGGEDLGLEMRSLPARGSTAKNPSKVWQVYHADSDTVVGRGDTKQKAIDDAARTIKARGNLMRQDLGLETEPEFYHNGRPAIELSRPREGQVKIQYLDGVKETPTVPRSELSEKPAEGGSSIADMVRKRLEAERAKADAAEPAKDRFVGDLVAGDKDDDGNDVFGNFSKKADAEAKAREIDGARIVAYEDGKYKRGWLVAKPEPRDALQGVEWTKKTVNYNLAANGDHSTEQTEWTADIFGQEARITHLPEKDKYALNGFKGKIQNAQFDTLEEAKAYINKAANSSYHRYLGLPTARQMAEIRAGKQPEAPTKGIYSFLKNAGEYSNGKFFVDDRKTVDELKAVRKQLLDVGTSTSDKPVAMEIYQAAQRALNTRIEELEPVSKPDFAGTVNTDAVTPDNADAINALLDGKATPEQRQQLENEAASTVDLAVPYSRPFETAEFRELEGKIGEFAKAGLKVGLDARGRKVELQGAPAGMSRADAILKFIEVSDAIVSGEATPAAKPFTFDEWLAKHADAPIGPAKADLVAQAEARAEQDPTFLPYPAKSIKVGDKFIDQRNGDSVFVVEVEPGGGVNYSTTPNGMPQGSASLIAFNMKFKRPGDSPEIKKPEAPKQKPGTVPIENANAPKIVDTGGAGNSIADMVRRRLEAERAKTEQEAAKNESLSLLNDAFDLGLDVEPPTLKSVVPATFNEELYAAKVKPGLDKAMEAFAGGTPQESVDALIDHLITQGVPLEKIEEMEPYIVRFLEEKNALQSGENGSKTQLEGQDDTNPTDLSGNDKDSDAVEGAGDVQGTDGDGQTGSGVSGPRSGGTRNPKSTKKPGDEPGSDLEGSGSKPDADGVQSGQAGEGDSDSTGDGVLTRVRRDYLAPVGSLTREGSWKATAENNLNAIVLAKKIEAEGRIATPEEQAQLSKFVGWGASEIRNNIFKDPDGYSIKADWKDLARRLQTELTPEEIKTAERSTQYAHYTSEKVIRGVWSALQQFGFSKGAIMEPGMGIGLFAVAAPRELIENSNYTGIEMDAMTARIAKLLLPDQAVLETDFTKQKLPENHFDVAIGNPPFSATKILADPKYKKYRFLLHDYFFAKSLDSVRPGGLLVFVTSKGTMDKLNDAARSYMGDRADLLGAIRLPQTAFKQNAGTDVVTDVLFFRKRMDGEEPAGEKWLGHAEVTAANKYGQEHTGLVNEYYVNHPEMVLGEHSFAGEMRHGDNEYTVLPKDGDIEEQFLEAVKNLPKAVYAQQAKSEEIRNATAGRDWDPKAKKEGSLYIHDDGRLMRREGGSGAEVTVSPKDTKWLKDYVGLRTALKQAQYDQLNAEKEGADWEKSLGELNKEYDGFVKKHGNILAFTDREYTKTDDEGNEITTVTRSFKNEKLLSNDVENALVWTLERITDDGDIVKSDWLTKRVIKPPEPPKIENLNDALMVSLDTTGVLNIGHIAELIKPVRPMTEKQIIEDLGDLIYEVPGGGWVMADEYLSGNVKDKLEIAEAAASDPRFVRNVEALQKVQPLPLPPEKITVQIGATWVPVEHVAKFATEVLGIKAPRGAYGQIEPAVEFDSITNKWTVPGAHGTGSQSKRSATKEWGTEYRSPEEILEAALNSETVTIMETDPGPPRRTFVNKDAVAGVQAKIEKMNQAFKPWLFSEPERTKELTDLYNRKMNVMAERVFDGQHLTTPGLSVKYKLYPHQKRVVWRIIQTGNSYLAHSVGAGKTLEMIVSAMEQKRLGLISKPMFIVPNHMLKQFSSEFLDAYPLANIMVADEQNFHTDNRKRFVAQAAFNDLDAVILTHSAFGLLRNTEESSRIVLDDMLAEMRDAMDELTTGTNRDGKPIGANVQDTATISRIQARIESIEQRFFGRMGSGRDNVLDFEELGVDFLYVDEAHEFRKLDFVTNQTNLKGVDPNGSMRALDLMVKSRWLDRQRPGRSMVLASGTPITNTMAELYTIQRFLGHRALIDDGLDNFDAWARQFGEVEEKIEANAAGGYKPVKRFRKIVNTGVLMQRVLRFMDVLTMSQLGELIKLPTIKLNSKGVHAAEVRITDRYPELEEYLKGPLARRIEACEAWKPTFQQKYNPDPMIAIIGDGQLAAFDMRFINPSLPSNPASKLNRMIDGIIDAYHKYNDLEYVNKNTGEAYPIKGAAHIVFSYGGFGDQVAANRGFNAKNWLRKRLVEAGIPNGEIAFISDYKTSAAKQSLFKEIREGKKKVLVGSPKNMGTGVNAQLRLKTLHYGMAPWFPADIEQPHGRIVRQGNQNDEVELYWYAAKGTYDETQWGMLASKGKMIEDAMSGKYDGDIEDVSESSQYAMASALSSGDPRALRYAELQGLVEKYRRLEQAFHSSQHRMESERSSLYSRWGGIPKVESDIKEIDDAIQVAPEHVSKDNFSLTIGKETFNKDSDKNNAEIGDALKAAWEKIARANKEKAINTKKEIKFDLGTYMGKFRVWGSAYLGFGDKVTTQLAVTIGDLTNRLNDSAIDIDDIAGISESGLILRLYNAVNNLGERKAAAERVLAQKKAELQQVEEALGRPFEFEKELADARSELNQLGMEMAGIGLKPPPDTMTAEQLQAVLDAFKVQHARKAMSDAAAGRTTQQFEDQDIEPHALKSVMPDNDQERAPIFYSQVEQTIADKMPNKASAAQVRGLLKPEYGIKQEELDWLGMDQFLADNPNPTKQEVLDFIRANSVSVEEVLKGGHAFPQEKYEQFFDLLQEADDLGFNNTHEAMQAIKTHADWVKRWDVSDMPELITLGNEYRKSENRTKYDQYTLPGGENYRELLLTLPSKEIDLTTNDKWKQYESTGTYPTVAGQQYQSRHWSEPNVLVHIRFDDRDGGKTLHIAEVQSDWHQAARSRRGNEIKRLAKEKGISEIDAAKLVPDNFGYKKDLPNPGNFTNFVRKVKGLDWSDEQIRKAFHNPSNPEFMEFLKVVDARNANELAVPDAPFKTSWHMLAMKRMIRYAAENGYDRITWDTGDTNAERYDISREIDKIYWKAERGAKTVAVHPKNAPAMSFQIGEDGIAHQDPSGPDISKDLDGKHINDIVGKEIGDKIVDAPDGELSGEGLKVGGNGMRGFYDKKFLNDTNKYVKKWGAKVEAGTLKTDTPRERDDYSAYRVERTDDEGNWPGMYRVVYPTGETFEEPMGTRADAQAILDLLQQRAKDQNASDVETKPVHSLDVTPEMKYSALKEGQRLHKVLTEDEMTPAERMTFEEMKALPFKEFDELLPDAEATRMGNQIKANAQAHEIYRRTFEEAGIRTGRIKRGSKTPEGLFQGVFMKPEAVAETVDILNEKEAEAKQYGYTKEEIDTFHDLAALLTNAAASTKDGTAIIYIFDSALPHEVFHDAEYQGSIEKSLLSRHTDETKTVLDAHPIVQKLWAGHFSRHTEYTSIKNNKMLKAVLRSEIPPYLLELSDKDLASYGITPEQRADYLLTWFRGYADKNGIDSLDQFDRDELDVQTFIDQIKSSSADQNGQARKTDESNPQGSLIDGEPETRAGPASGRPNPTGKIEPVAFGPEAEYYELQDGQKFASLPATLRRAGLDADEVVYQVFGDKAAIAEAEDMLQRLGIPGSIKLLRELKADAQDVSHAVLSFMLQRALLDHAINIKEINPQAAKEAHDLALKLGREHSMKAVGAGRYTRAASIVSHSLEHFIYTVNDVVTEKYGEDKTLSPEEWERIEAVGREAEEAFAQIAQLEKENLWLQRKLKRLEKERDGLAPRRRSKASQKVRQQAADRLIDKHADRVEKIKQQLIAQFGQPGIYKSVAEMPEQVNGPLTLKAVLDTGEFDDDTLDQFAEVGAMMLVHGMSGPDDYLPPDFHAEMMATFGDVIGPNFQEIYRRSWNRRNEWLDQIRAEQTKERIENKVGEELEDWQIEEILGEQKERAKRRRAIENVHRLMSGGENRRGGRNLKDYKRLISENASDDAAAVAGILLAENTNINEIYRQLEAMGITDPAKQREALRKGNEAFEKAKLDLKIENDAVSNEILETSRQQHDIDALRWKARQRGILVQKAAAQELRRIKDGEFWYRTGQVMDVGNAMRTMMASFDLSGTLRQGGWFSFATPELQREALAAEFNSITEENYGHIIMAIERHPLFMLAQRSGVHFAVAGTTEETFGEEVFRGEETLEKVPILGPLAMKYIVKPSERTYTAFLDKQRMIMFDVFAKELMAQGMTYQRNKAEFNKIGEFVSVATGRGTVPRNNWGKLLMAMPLFAPRYTLSRFQLLNMTLNPVAYSNMPPAARKIIAKSAVRYYGTMALLYAVAVAMGLSTADDDDSDFLKIKIGNLRLDPFAGLLQPARTMIRVLHSIIRGDRVPQEGLYDSKKAVSRFIQGKLSPFASLAWDWWKDEDFNGNDFQWSKAIYSRLMPLTIGDTIEAYQLDGVVGAAKSLPATIFGLGAQTYASSPEKPKTEAEKLAAKVKAMQMENRPGGKKQDPATRTLIQSLTARSRVGDPTVEDELNAMPEGKLSDDQKARIRAARDKSYLEDKAEDLSLPDFEAVFKVATPEERQRLLPLLNKKMKNADVRDKLTPDERKRLENLGGHVIGDVPMPEQIKKEFQKFKMRVPDVGESIVLKKGQGKTKLTSDEYEQYRRDALTEIYKRAAEVIASDAYNAADDAKKQSLLDRAVKKGRGLEQKQLKKELRTSHSQPLQ